MALMNERVKWKNENKKYETMNKNSKLEPCGGILAYTYIRRK